MIKCLRPSVESWRLLNVGESSQSCIKNDSDWSNTHRCFTTVCPVWPFRQTQTREAVPDSAAKQLFPKSIKRRFVSPYCNLDRELQEETSATLDAYPIQGREDKKEADEGQNLREERLKWIHNNNYTRRPTTPQACGERLPSVRSSRKSYHIDFLVSWFRLLLQGRQSTSDPDNSSTGLLIWPLCPISSLIRVERGQ